MTTKERFPEELMELIINSVDSAEQLAQCSLVSKRWARLASEIMHTKTISVKSETGAFRLYKHLQQNPYKIPYIKHLQFELDSDNLSFIVKELLHLTFKSNIKILSGSVRSDEFFHLLFQIMDDSSSDFDYLVELPRYTGINDALIISQALRFKNLCRGLTLKVGVSQTELFQYLLSQLDQFKNVAYLLLKGFVYGLQGAEDVLKRSSVLEKLEFKNFDYGGSTMRRMSAVQVYRWAKANVKRETSLKTLIIQSDYHPEFIEYLLYKYPMVTHVEVNGLLSNLPTNDDLYRILGAIGKVPSQRLTIAMPCYSDISHIHPYLTYFKEKVTFDVDKIYGRTKLVLKYVSNK